MFENVGAGETEESHSLTSQRIINNYAKQMKSNFAAEYWKNLYDVEKIRLELRKY